MITSFLQVTIENKATDLHLTVGKPPMLRIDGELVKMDIANLSSNDMDNMLGEVMPE